MIEKNYYLLLIFLSAMISLTVAAGPSFRVVNAIGTASLIDEKNESKSLSQGVFLPTNSKIMVSKGSQLTFNSETGAVFHLSEGSAVEIWRDQLVLLSGTLWVQSPKDEKEQNIETMNSFVEFKKAEFVLSFDDIVKKSQVFVISGHASISNIFMKDKKELLVSGEISFVQKDFQQGMPRRAALIGNESLAAVFNKFKGIKPGDENFQTILNQEHPNKERVDFTASGGRGIASVPGEVGGIYFLPKSFSAPKRFHPLKNRDKKREPASVEKTIVSSDKFPRLQNSKMLKPIRVFDISNHYTKKSVTTILQEETNHHHHHKVEPMVVEKRLPASLKKNPNPVETKKENEPDFESLIKELKGVSPDHNEVY